MSTCSLTIDALIELLDRLRTASAEVTARLVAGNDPAGEKLASLAEMVGLSRELIALLVDEQGANGRVVPVGSESALADVRKLLEDSIGQLQTAEECARVSLLRLAARLDEAVQGEKGARAYQARGSA